jgi:hypothetical protein
MKTVSASAIDYLKVLYQLMSLFNFNLGEVMNFTLAFSWKIREEQHKTMVGWHHVYTCTAFVELA